ncbi:MAG TPA: GNAT family N-acetyltransferase [Pyrinomonadaceae bacterium]|jgi:ribosomal protein S18 acetylase RimI-like enzyme
MKSQAIIRYAALDDARLLARLGRETFGEAFAAHPLMPADDLRLYMDEAFTTEQMTRELSESKALFLLAEISGEPAAYAKLLKNTPAPGSESKNQIKLQRLYAEQKFLGTGIGHDLMDRCLREAAQSGHDGVWLSVWEHNPRAQAFYRKWKFETCGTIDFRLGNSIMTDFLMKREI